jgi:hypothetical protein
MPQLVIDYEGASHLEALPGEQAYKSDAAQGQGQPYDAFSFDPRSRTEFSRGAPNGNDRHGNQRGGKGNNAKAQNSQQKGKQKKTANRQNQKNVSTRQGASNGSETASSQNLSSGGEGSGYSSGSGDSGDSIHTKKEKQYRSDFWAPPNGQPGYAAQPQVPFTLIGMPPQSVMPTGYTAPMNFAQTAPIMQNDPAFLRVMESFAEALNQDPSMIRPGAMPPWDGRFADINNFGMDASYGAAPPSLPVHPTTQPVQQQGLRLAEMLWEPEIRRSWEQQAPMLVYPGDNGSAVNPDVMQKFFSLVGANEKDGATPNGKGKGGGKSGRAEPEKNRSPQRSMRSEKWWGRIRGAWE